MKLLIAGATGLIGQALVNALKHDITILTTRAKIAKDLFKPHRIITWQQADDFEPGWIKAFDIVINLSGYNIGAKKWRAAIKKRIIDSRVQTTANIVKWCLDAGAQSPRIMNASAIGIYGLQKNLDEQNTVIYDERSTPPNPATDFLSEVGIAWEAALTPAKEAGIHVVNLRFSVVLSKNGGALAKMLPAFKLGLGGKIGSGRQPFSWISLEDIVRGVAWLIENPQIHGPVNFVAPDVVSQSQFAKKLAAALHRPCICPMPSIAVKLLFGQMGYELLLNGQQVESDVLTNHQFKFSYPNLESLMTKLFKKP